MSKILISANTLWNFVTFRKGLIRALKKEGYDVICVAPRDDFSKSSEEILRSLGGRFIEIPLDRKGINPFSDLLYIWRFYRLYRSEMPDLALHFTVKPNIYGTLAARVARIPSINTINGLGSGLLGGGVFSTFLLTLYRIALKRSFCVFFQNRADMRLFLDRKIVREQKCRLVPGSGIDTAKFDRCNPPQQRSPEKFRFLMVARMLRDKGIYEYIEACRRLREINPSFECLLGGFLDAGNPSAIDEEELQAWIDEGVVTYLGKTDDIREFFLQADVVVLPSYREGLSRVLLEAASCRKALVTTDVPGCRELVVDGESGFLCRAADADDLFRAMRRISDSREMLTRMGERGRRHVAERFSDRKVQRIYLDAISTALNPP